jgi:hypothetical protein
MTEREKEITGRRSMVFLEKNLAMCKCLTVRKKRLLMTHGLAGCRQSKEAKEA